LVIFIGFPYNYQHGKVNYSPMCSNPVAAECVAGEKVWDLFYDIVHNKQLQPHSAQDTIVLILTFFSHTNFLMRSPNNSITPAGSGDTWAITELTEFVTGLHTKMCRRKYLTSTPGDPSFLYLGKKVLGGALTRLRASVSSSLPLGLTTGCVHIPA
jgi:hypothetical protein